MNAESYLLAGRKLERAELEDALISGKHELIAFHGVAGWVKLSSSEQFMRSSSDWSLPKSAAQIIDAMFFGKNAPHKNEFDQLYAALFTHHEKHFEVIRALAARRSGMCV